MSSNDFLQALSEDRSKDAEVLKKPQYAGIMNMVTELYPDNAHFIYELLQNAEDTEATTITFSLTSEKLVAEHNGIRLFTEKDVESITSIGNSTKRDDVTSIGKFGVGFKAVFSYTNTPTVYSGDFAFKIRDLVVPEIIAPLDERTDTTIFEFPFNNSKKPALLATQEVEKGFVGFGDNTLLFLSHIRKINYSLPDGSQGSLERLDHENGRIEIRATHPHSETIISHWLHFQKDVDVTDADGNIKNCRVAIAYQLEKVADKNKDSETWKIIPVHGGGQVSIYFPAEKETSKLRFHIHAPFASTVARDSVRDCDDNQKLREHLAELIVESFTAIRDQEMLIMSFLAVLPTPKDELAEFYEPIRKKIVDAFKTQSLTPTKSGRYAAADALYRGLTKISDVITDEDLSVLTASEIPLWAANAAQLNQREDNFLDSLAIKKWDFDKLLGTFEDIALAGHHFNNPDDDEIHNEDEYIKQKKIKSWFEQKEDRWLVYFYASLNGYSDITEWQYLNFPLVRVNSEDGVKHVIGNEAYFEPLHGISTNGVHIVKREIYTKDNAECDIDRSAEEFLKKIGVRPFDEKAAIKLRLDFYESTPPSEITDEYYEDIKQFVDYLTRNPSEKTLFQFVKFLLTDSTDKKDKPYWEKIESTCLDKPFVETGLAELELFEIHQKRAISSYYFEHLNEIERKDFLDFLYTLGVMHKLEVVQLEKTDAINSPNNPYPSNLNWTSTGTVSDYSIPKLEKYLNAQSMLASKLIWNAILTSDAKFKDASFQPNRSTLYPIKTVESQLIYYLKQYAWIPTQLGEFRNPQAVTRDELPDDFIFDNRNGLLTAIEFGNDSVVRAEEERKRKEPQNESFKFATELGAKSVDQAKEAIEFLLEMEKQGKTLTQIREILNPKKPDFENDYSSNPERRAEKVQEAAADAPENRTEMRQRSVAVDNTETKNAAKSYLRDHYTDDKILYCQICKKEMPFKLLDDSYYFEAVQLINNLPNRHKENYIALCPTDAAKFQYANPSKDKISDLVRELIHDRSPTEINGSHDDKNCFKIELAGNFETVQFRREHLIDLKAILSEL